MTTSESLVLYVLFVVLAVWFLFAFKLHVVLLADDARLRLPVAVGAWLQKMRHRQA